jgi:hypothetical protein
MCGSINCFPETDDRCADGPWLVMGVDQNKGMKWVRSSAALVSSNLALNFLSENAKERGTF